MSDYIPETIQTRLPRHSLQSNPLFLESTLTILLGRIVPVTTTVNTPAQRTRDRYPDPGSEDKEPTFSWQRVSQARLRMSVLERIARINQSTRARREKPRLYFRQRLAPIQDDAQDGSFFSRRRHIMDQFLSPTISDFGLDGGDSLPYGTGLSPQPGAPSIESLIAIESGALKWNRAALLELSDSVRGSLQRDSAEGPDAEKLSCFLDAALRDEEQTYQPMLDFETVEYARLDKLVADLLRAADGPKTTGPNLAPPHAVTGAVDEASMQSRVNAMHAKSLRRLWRRRFREQYFMMDQHRCAILVKGGRLKDVSFSSSLAYDLGTWHTKVTGPISELEGNLQFDPGHWWLNLTCAERDGMVASSLETPTRGRYGITTLPLLTGWEEMIRPNMYRYVREGKAADMHIALISQVGRQIRVLRGYLLKSVLAPQAGVRYDGLFTIKQFGFKLDAQTNLYRLELRMERVPDQKKSQEDIKHIPRPSQLDDWTLFEKLEGDKIKMLRGETRYLEWKLGRQEQIIDVEEWRRASLFKASFTR
ncbi:hypothetical protein GGR54DRAFT_181281 [Hypoxylon sp. NC1633]|nr:hypothetical protein GGR54DRAFT_181281 [Hypoxylon sp. NC1633]